jgi:diguanylate cyclase (GGDEF)-like protein
MPNSSPDQMETAAERLRKLIQDLGLDHPTSDSGVVTISAGVAMRVANNGGAEGTLKRADDALYKAKESGRNRVIADTAV